MFQAKKVNIISYTLPLRQLFGEQPKVDPGCNPCEIQKLKKGVNVAIRQAFTWQTDVVPVRPADMKKKYE